MLIPRGGFWSTMAIEDRGMLGRIESGCEPPYPGGLVSEGESREQCLALLPAMSFPFAMSGRRNLESAGGWTIRTLLLCILKTKTQAGVSLALACKLDSCSVGECCPSCKTQKAGCNLCWRQDRAKPKTKQQLLHFTQRTQATLQVKLTYAFIRGRSHEYRYPLQHRPRIICGFSVQNCGNCGPENYHIAAEYRKYEGGERYYTVKQKLLIIIIIIMQVLLQSNHDKN